jgi:predicted dehydrogenase
VSGQVRVGIVGANPTRGWSNTAHVPALRGLEGFAITAVSTTRLESARETAEQVGAAHAFADARELAASDEVDVVVVSVRVPYHHELVSIAIDAGKHVFCEWPLGASTDEATDLIEKAEKAGVRHVIGLQGRRSPIHNYVRHLIADGYLGTLHSATVEMVTSGRGGPTIAPDRAWTADKTKGVTLLSIIGGHTLDTVRYILGDYTEVEGIVATLDPVTTIEGTTEQIPVTAPDHVLIQGGIGDGALFTASFLSAARSLGVKVAFHGSAGSIVIEGPGTFHLADADLRLVGATGGGALEPIAVPASFDPVPASVPAGPGRNVAGLYLSLAEAIETGAPLDPDFGTALSMHRVLDAIEASSAERHPVATYAIVAGEVARAESAARAGASIGTRPSVPGSPRPSTAAISGRARSDTRTFANIESGGTSPRIG